MLRQAYVHVNEEGTLHVIANLVKKRFSVPSDWSCLYNQFQFAAQSLTGLPIAKFYSREFRDSQQGHKGHTVQDILIFANKTIRSFLFGAEHIEDIDRAVETIKDGQPVVMIVSSRNPFWSDTSDLWKHECSLPKHCEPGECIRFSGDIMEPPDVGYHALLLIGYDSKYDFVIGRESGNDYGYKGYFKIKKSLLAKNKKSAAYLKFTVQDK